MSKLPKFNNNIQEKKLENNSDPKILFGILNDDYIQNKVVDNEKFINHSSFESFCKDPKQFNESHKALFSKNFYDSLQKSQSRIWLIDGYLNELDSRKKLESFLDIFYDKLSYINDIRIFFKSDTKRDDVIELLDIYNTELVENINKEIKYRFFDYKYIHDRFAIIDDKLWHFGSDVGSSSRCLNATSYGWDAEYFKAINFFTDLWNSKNVK